jgi:hypothetical protein
VRYSDYLCYAKSISESNIENTLLSYKKDMGKDTTSFGNYVV